MKNNTIYGFNAVTETIKRSPERCRELLISRNEKGRTTALVESAAKHGIPIRRTGRRELEQLLEPGCNHQGVLLLLHCRQPAAAVSEYWQERLEQALKAGSKPLVAILDQIQDPGNLGAIIRSAAQFGVSELFIPKKNAATVTPVALKAACGGENHLYINRETNLARTLDEIQQMGIWSGAAAGESGAAPLWKMDLNRPFCFILGSEGKGIRPLIRTKADYLVAIPTLQKLDSLNVSVAAGILFHEAFRQQSEH